MQPKKLEQYKYFPHIAWTLCIAFAGFVFMLSLKAQNSYESLSQSQLSHEYRLQQIEATLGNTPSATSTTPR